ncbi:MAG: hypothetical protein HWN65_07115 [Candidatus Helarchaeota archaeon]|nr:hypothetical protein [Candidatus Helarchaeota archaeon]
MNSERTNIIADFEEKEKKILEFEDEFAKMKESSKEYEKLREKMKSSQDEAIASQIDELHSKMEEHEQTNNRLRTALQQIQEENIALEDELNSIKSEHGDIGELKSKLQVLEDTVITQQKEIVEKDKILKGKRAEEAGLTTEGTLQKFIVGKMETIKEVNRLLKNSKFRILLIVPSFDDLKQLNIPENPKIDTRIATAFDLANKFHREFIHKFPHVEFRNYSKSDRWGIERDAEEVCLVAESENKDYIGISSSDSKICDLYSKLLTEAWLTASKVSA